MVIYCLSIRNYKKLTEKLNCEIFYHNARNKRKILEGFVSGKQQIVIATNTFGMGINIADIKIIVHANEPKIMLDSAQKNGQAGQDEKKNKTMVVWKQIETTRGKKKKGKKENKNKKQMEQKKIIKFLETKCQRVILDKYLDRKKN